MIERLKAAVDAFFNWPSTVKMNTHAHYCYCVEIARGGKKNWLYYTSEDDASMALDYYKNTLIEARMFPMMEYIE